MKHKILTLIAALTPLILATIAFAFSIRATSSRAWSIRHQYNISEYEEDWTKPIVTEYRSPFVICTQNVTNVTSLVCQTFSPTDLNGTSCEPLSATNKTIMAQTGDERLCQEIHWSGNLAIASTTCIGIGFLMVVAMALFSFIAVFTSGLEEDQASGPEASNSHEERKDGVVSNATEGYAEHSHHHHQRRPRHRRHPRASAAANYLNFTAIFALVAGALLYIFAQFYGVLAFTVSAPDNGQYAAYGETPNNNVGYTHGPWIQGSAISVYASVAWGAAGLAALSAGIVWSLPNVRRYSVLTE